MSKCCNDNCRQGRDCPNKTNYVDAVGNFIFFAFVLFFACFGAFIALNWEPRQTGYKVYDCNISEISPDFPLEAKEACRKLRANK